MQTIQLKVHDSSVGIVMTLLDNLKRDIVQDVKIINKHQAISQDDTQTISDPYFDSRKKELHKIRADIKSGTMEMLSEEQYEQEIEQFFESIEK